MSELLEHLKREFQSEDYRYGYAESFLWAKLAAQIKAIREQRGLTREQMAQRMNITQAAYSRLENVNHYSWKTHSLWKIAKALGVRLDISFKTFGTIPEDMQGINREDLQVPCFEDDPAFKESSLSTGSGA